MGETMRILCGCIAMLALAGLAEREATGQSGKPEKSAEPTKSVAVKLDKYVSIAPATWKVEKPANRLRSHQFRLLRADGDKADAELAILPDVKGKPEDNMRRWSESFADPDGKPISEIAKVEKFDVNGAHVHYLDARGTYLYKERPFDPASKLQPRPGYRMLAVIVETEDGSYQLRVTGPMKTVEQHKKDFDAWLKAFKPVAE
jgi:hypothetical protein